MMEALRAAGELRDGDARAATAERAVAPFAIEEEVEEVLEWVGAARREVGVALAGAVVAMVVYCYETVFKLVER